jgi:hypothetical protein
MKLTLRYWRRFPEVNLRFYVKRNLPDTPESVQRGVVFVSEIVPRFAYPVKEYDIVCDFEKVYGQAFAFLNLQKPASVFVAEGSEVFIHHKRVLKG